MDEDNTPNLSPAVDGASTSNRAAARRPKKVERSCILCHRRKIRCDKRSPCSTCTKTGVLCCYPALDQPARRQPRKATIADVAERLVRLERTLVAISSDPPVHQNLTDATTSSASPSDHGLSSRDDGLETASVAEEFLLRNGESSRYMNDLLMSRVLEEEDELRSALGAQETQKNESDTDEAPFQALDLNGILAGDNPSSYDCTDFHPPKWQATQLWQTFVNFVDIFNKILHIPTTELVVFKAIDNLANTPADVNCLLFAVYFAAVTALPDNDVAGMLGWPKRKALTTFRRGLERSLMQANFLESPTLTSLQAMGLFMQAIRAHNTGRSVWVLNGLVLRAAQSIGLHRDGLSLGLSVFEAELRRRLWWCMLATDVRSAEDHGITVSSADSSININFPANVNDSELYPGMTQIPESRGRWTDMSLSLLMREQCLVRKRLYEMLPPLHTVKPTAAARQEIIRQAKAQCEEEYFQYCNPIAPVQRSGMLIGRAVLDKLDFISKLQWASMANQNTTRGLEMTDEMLAEACDILSYGAQIQTDELLRNYRWILEIYPPYHVLLYVLWRLCVQPTGPSVERAWGLVDGCFNFHCTKLGFESAPPGSKWTVLKMFRKKAQRIKHMATNGKSSVNGKGSSNSDKAKGLDETGRADANGLEGDGFGNDFSWATDDTELPDWNELVDDLRIEGYEIQI